MINMVIHLIVRLLILILFFSDVRMTRKVKAKDTTLHRELSQAQKYERILYYVLLIAGLIVPFDWIYLIVPAIALAYFFYYTDREIYIGSNAMYFRAVFYEYKRIENIQLTDHVLQFDYKNEHIRLSRPLIDEALLEKEVVHEVNKRIANSEKRKYKGKKHA